MSLSAEKIAQLRAFVNLCKASPVLLHKPELEFLRDWLER